jgi:hypothetical protein
MCARLRVRGAVRMTTFEGEAGVGLGLGVELARLAVWQSSRVRALR